MTVITTKKVTSFTGSSGKCLTVRNKNIKALKSPSEESKRQGEKKNVYYKYVFFQIEHIKDIMHTQIMLLQL